MLSRSEGVPEGPRRRFLATLEAIDRGLKVLKNTVFYIVFGSSLFSANSFSNFCSRSEDSRAI